MNGLRERLTLLIEELEITKTAFAKKLNITQPYVTKLLKNGNPSDRLIEDICEKFNVNEDWLRTGNGGKENMFIPDDIKYLQNVGKLGKEQNEFKKFYLNMMLNLPDEYWDYIYNEFKKFEKKKEG